MGEGVVTDSIPRLSLVRYAAMRNLSLLRKVLAAKLLLLLCYCWVRRKSVPIIFPDYLSRLSVPIICPDLLASTTTPKVPVQGCFRCST